MAPESEASPAVLGAEEDVAEDSLWATGSDTEGRNAAEPANIAAVAAAAATAFGFVIAGAMELIH